MMLAKLLKEIKVHDRDHNVERVISKDTILRIGRIMDHAIYAYIGVASDPVLLPKDDLETTDG